MCMCAYDLKDNWRSFVAMSAKGIISLSASWFSNENGPMMLVATNAVDFSHILETAYFTSKPILSTQNIDKKSQK